MYIKDSAVNGNNFLDQLKTHLIDNNWDLLDDRVATTRELYFQNTNTSVIIAFKVETDNLTYFNLLLNNILSYNSANTFYNQIGSISSSTSDNSFPMFCLSVNLPMNYYLFINDNRVIFTVNISNIYNTAYIGKIESVVNPLDYENPIFVGGHAYSRTQLLSDTDVNNTCFLFRDSTNTTLNGRPRLRKNDNLWSIVTTQYMNEHSFMYPTFSSTNNNEYSSHYTTTEIEKVLIFNINGPAGYLDGIVRVFGNNLSACSEFTIESDDYIIFPNIFRSSQKNHFAIKKG